MKVPLIVKWPGKIKSGTSEHRVVATDLYPTILAATGLPLRPEQHVDGVNLMPLLTMDAALKPRPIVFHFPHYSHATGPFSAVIDDNWKLIRFYNDQQGEYLLYDLAADPEEQNNVAAAIASMRDKLIRRLDRSLREMKAEMPVANSAYNPNAQGKRFNLKKTRDLAEKERVLFESRLNQ